MVPDARAHDPGQGEPAGDVPLTVTATGKAITLEGAADGADCRELEPRGLTTRRGGTTLRAPLDLSGCKFSGQIRVPERGRWFVYAELRRRGRDIETWLPVHAGDGVERNSELGRYAYEPNETPTTTAQVVTSIVLYAGILGLIAATFALVRPDRPARGPAPRATASAK